MLFKSNPEFMRNIWMEFTKRRLISMPLVLIAMFFMGYLWNNGIADSRISWIPFGVYAILTYIWGTRAVSESVIREINLGTWSLQRMSVIGPWKMAWGKLFGSTALIWYGNLFCLAYYFNCERKGSPMSEVTTDVVLMVVFGVLAHGVSFATSLFSMKYRRSFEKFEVLFYQLLGTFVFILLMKSGLSGYNFGTWNEGLIRWFGTVYALNQFAIFFVSCCVVWILIGSYMLMRSEFELKNSPFVWLVFAIFGVLLLYGIDFQIDTSLPDDIKFPVPTGTTLGFVFVMCLMYLVACGESRDALRLHMLLYLTRNRRFKELFNALPRTLVTLPVVIGMAVLVAVQAEPPIPGERGLQLAATVPFCIVAAMFFMIRDVSFIYLMAVSRRARSNDNLTAIITILVSYAVFPAIIFKMEWDLWASLFVPWPQDNLALIVLPAVAQALAVAAWLGVYWYREQDTIDADAHKMGADKHANVV